MTTCREVHDFLMAWLDDELEPEVGARFEAHVEACPCCKHYLDSYRETIALGRTAFEPCADVAEQPHPDLPDELVKAVLAARRKPASPDDGAA